MFPNIPKEQVEQKYQACGNDINRTISAILDGDDDGKSISNKLGIFNLEILVYLIICDILSTDVFIVWHT